jgi:predicted N-acetyltransferase YhbS
MSSTMQILPIADCEQHLDTAARWIWEEWKETSGLTLAQTRSQLTERSTCPPTLVAVVALELLGVIAFRRVKYRGREPLSLFINSLFVRPSDRGRGIGTALLSAALGRVGTEDPAVHVYTGVRAWYEARGFAVVDEEPDGANVVMCRKLG